ncbi:YdcF family protein [Corynebacterium propinquum]|uniref:YdcF family protein n=1 Tax=Corynebacterium propinquum TaxID=43769 RepID=UPI0003A97472|nr:YdcF family protein [Corynebacterium propinquum]MDK4251434.1 YdcF family protein [Corynebacterium propinquum]MDK4292952.1 YdcF family protein [Corynebacterium propinquum]MDK4319038.1 YdcF family protein [Corynebacterium propinquum]
MKPQTIARAGLATLTLAPAIIAAVQASRVLTIAYRRRYLPVYDPEAIVVMGTAQYNGTPSRQFAARLDQAVFAAHIFPDAQVLCVGGALPGDTVTEAEVGADYLRAHGIVRAEAVGKGSDSAASLAAVLSRYPHLQGRDVLLVTDPNHSARAEKIARRCGVLPQAFPTPDSPSQFPSPAWWKSLLHEIGGLTVADVYVLAGASCAVRLESVLRRVQAIVWPSRRMRHEYLRAQHAREQQQQDQQQEQQQQDQQQGSSQ